MVFKVWLYFTTRIIFIVILGASISYLARTFMKFYGVSSNDNGNESDNIDYLYNYSLF
jgi:hypothetical protein